MNACFPLVFQMKTKVDDSKAGKGKQTYRFEWENREIWVRLIRRKNFKKTTKSCCNLETKFKIWKTVKIISELFCKQSFCLLKNLNFLQFHFFIFRFFKSFLKIHSYFPVFQYFSFQFSHDFFKFSQFHINFPTQINLLHFPP